MSTNTALDQIKARVEGHTGGPWVIAADLPTWESEEGSFDVGPDDAPTVAVIEGLADAELIAAAPKLLAALEAVEVVAARQKREAIRLRGRADSGELSPEFTHRARSRAQALDGIVTDLRRAITDALA